MRTSRLLFALVISLLLAAEGWAQKPANHFAAALAKVRPPAARLANRGPLQTVSRPGRGVLYEWDDNTQAWSTTPTVETYLYDSRANVILETFADSATAQPLSRNLYTYDAQGRNTEELFQEWLSGAWTNESRYIVAYDAQGNPTQELDQQWQNGTWATRRGSQYVNTYTNNVLTEQIIKDWDNGVFVNDQRLLFAVANGQWTDVVQQVWELGTWENEARFTDLVWHNWPAQQPAAYREQDWQGVWEDEFRYAITYAANGTVVGLEEEATSLNPTAWALSGRSTETFDSFGNELGFRFESRQGNAWVLEFEDRNLLTYTAANDVRFRVNQRFFRAGGSTAFGNEARYNYSNFQRITLGTAPAALAAQLQLYPNPTAGSATLTLPGLRAGEVQVDVLNALGQPLLRRTARPSAGLLAETLDLRALPMGVYLVRIHAPEGTVVKRLVKE